MAADRPDELAPPEPSPQQRPERAQRVRTSRSEYLIGLFVAIAILLATGIYFGYSLDQISLSNHKLLAAGAVSSQHEEHITEQLSSLIDAGKTQTATAAKKAAASAKQADAAIHQIEHMIEESRVVAAQDRSLICSVAQRVKVSTPVIQSICSHQFP